MTTPALFKEYIWLINTIYKAKALSLNDINERWVEMEMSGGVELLGVNSYVRSNYW